MSDQVWIVLHTIASEGSDVLGVFSTEEAAAEFASTERVKLPSPSYGVQIHSIDVERWSIDAPSDSENHS